MPSNLQVFESGLPFLTRQCYEDLDTIIAKDINGSVRGAVITGTPGIGKTVFGLYELMKVVNEGKTVYYHRADIYVKCCNGFATVLKKKDFLREVRLASTNDWYIVDGVKPYFINHTKAFILLTTSPRKEIWYKFSDEHGANTYWMPVWTEEELNSCREVAYPFVSEETMKSLYDKFGGVPRYVLSQAPNKGVLEKLTFAFREVSCDEYLRFNRGLTSITDPCHELLHLKPSSEFLDPVLVAASPFVTKELTRRAKSDGLVKIINFIDLFADSKEASTYRGWLFEGVVHRYLLQCRYRFGMRSLQNSWVGKLNFKVLLKDDKCVKMFDKVTDIGLIEKKHVLSS